MIAAFALLIGGLIPGATGSGLEDCRPDRTPGIVTAWEHDHVFRGETRHGVTCQYGTTGQVIQGFWGTRWHEIVSYPTRTGTTEVTFVDRGSTGHTYRLARTYWPTATS